MRGGRRLGAALLAAGLVLMAIGGVGALSGSSGMAAPSASVPPASQVAQATPSASVAPSVIVSAAPSASASPNPTTPAPTPSPTPSDDQLARAFLAGFTPAVRAADVDVLVPLLHPATIERYGEAACRAASPSSPTRHSRCWSPRSGRGRRGTTSPTA